MKVNDERIYISGWIIPFKVYLIESYMKTQRGAINPKEEKTAFITSAATLIWDIK